MPKQPGDKERSPISRRALIGGVATVGVAALTGPLSGETAGAAVKPEKKALPIAQRGGLAVVGTLRHPASTKTPIATPQYRLALTFSAEQGSYTKQLPDAAKCTGAELWLFKAPADTSNHIVYFEAHPGQTIDGTASRIGLVGAGHFFKLWSDGYGWRIGDMTSTLFQATFGAGKLGPGSTYTVGDKAPANPNKNDYWFNPKAGVVWAAVEDGAWSMKEIWQGAQIASMAVSGTTAKVTLAGTVKPVNLPLAPGGFLRVAGVRGGTVNGGPYQITAVAKAAGAAQVVSIAGLPPNASYTSGGVASLCAVDGTTDIWPAPVDLGTNELLANIVIPPSGQLEFELVWGGNTTPGDSGWPQPFDVGNNNYLTDGQNSVVAGGLSVARWPMKLSSKSSGNPKAGTQVPFTPGSHFQFRPVFKLWNKAPDGHWIFQDNSLQYFSVQALR